MAATAIITSTLTTASNIWAKTKVTLIHWYVRWMYLFWVISFIYDIYTTAVVYDGALQPSYFLPRTYAGESSPTHSNPHAIRMNCSIFQLFSIDIRWSVLRDRHLTELVTFAFRCSDIWCCCCLGEFMNFSCNVSKWWCMCGTSGIGRRFRRGRSLSQTGLYSSQSGMICVRTMRVIRSSRLSPSLYSLIPFLLSFFFLLQWKIYSFPLPKQYRKKQKMVSAKPAKKYNKLQQNVCSFNFLLAKMDHKNVHPIIKKQIEYIYAYLSFSSPCCLQLWTACMHGAWIVYA